jgi:hypothetical protein
MFYNILTIQLKSRYIHTHDTTFIVALQFIDRTATHQQKQQVC